MRKEQSCLNSNKQPSTCLSYLCLNLRKRTQVGVQVNEKCIRSHPDGTEGPLLILIIANQVNRCWSMNSWSEGKKNKAGLVTDICPKWKVSGFPFAAFKICEEITWRQYEAWKILQSTLLFDIRKRLGKRAVESYLHRATFKSLTMYNISVWYIHISIIYIGCWNKIDWLAFMKEWYLPWSIYHLFQYNKMHTWWFHRSKKPG